MAGTISWEGIHAAMSVVAADEPSSPPPPPGHTTDPVMQENPSEMWWTGHHLREIPSALLAQSGQIFALDKDLYKASLSSIRETHGRQEE